MEADRFTHQFREGSSFADIIDLYSFDKELRVLLFTAIQTIEVSVRTKNNQSTLLFNLVHFGLWTKIMRPMGCVSQRTWLLSVREVSRSHDDFITKHFPQV